MRQLSFSEIENPEYLNFVEKFKPKKTTDDCYTPENIYAVVADYVTEQYGVRREDMVRPFWPGGDYESYDYPEGCCVVDNPPFSIITQIARTLADRKIKYFLFCPYLTALQITLKRQGEITIIVAPVNIRYENGATIPTCFVTNMEKGTIVRTEPILFDRLTEANKANTKKRRTETSEI